MKQRSTRTVYKIVREYRGMLVSLYFNMKPVPWDKVKNEHKVVY